MALLINGVEHRARKRFFVGTHRVRSPEETVEQIRPHYRALGITRVGDVSGLDRIPISTVIAYRPNSRTLAAGSGKGFTKAAATASAVMEAAELQHAEYAELPSIFAPHAELDASERIARVDDLPLTNQNIFSPNRPEWWTSGWDLIGQAHTYVPTDIIDMAYHHARVGWRPMSFQVGSNGLASGNVLLEAVLAGLYECIERDATSCWAVAQHALHIDRPRVDVDTIELPTVRDLIDRLAAANVSLDLHDCTVDTNVPTFSATIHDLGDELGRYGGHGTHLDPEVAMLRAITEAVQGRVVYVAGSRDDLFDHSRHVVNRASRLPDDALVPIEAPRDARRYTSAATETFEGDLEIVLDRLRAAGLGQAIVVDLSNPELGIPVVRVFIPGAEGYTFRFYRAGHRAQRFTEQLAGREPVRR